MLVSPSDLRVPPPPRRAVLRAFVMTTAAIFDEPYHITRRFASLDHISAGRAGWNLPSARPSRPAASAQVHLASRSPAKLTMPSCLSAGHRNPARC